MTPGALHGRRDFLAQGGAAALASIALHGALSRTAMAQDNLPASGTPVSATPMADCPGQEQVTRNLELMDQLDFEGWNGRNWDLFSKLHASEVIVAGFGQATEGNAEHVAWAQAFIEQNPDSIINAHPIRIGAGDWTAVVGTFEGGGSMCTVARWENGQIVEEYLFSG